MGTDDNRNTGRGRDGNPGDPGGIYYGQTHKKSAGPGSGAGSRRPRGHRPPVALSILLDVVAAALLLGVFYVTNYMMVKQVGPVALPTPTPAAVRTPEATTGETASAPTATAAQATAEATADPNDWRVKFADKFTDGAVEITDRSYRSANISITITEVLKYNVTCYVADIYVADLRYFKTAFAKNPDMMGSKELTDKVAEENGAILAINGDHCTDNEGTVVRNGQMYREPKSSLDVLVMNYDGSMQVFSPEDFDVGKIKSEGAYQVWTFGPMLLQDGQPMTRFNATHTGTGLNPRTAVGYFEPGHYCFVVVGGRQEGYSEGYTMTQLSQLMYDLGCAEAYNLDGGRSSEMIFMGEMLNEQRGGRRSTPDILYIGDE